MRNSLFLLQTFAFEMSTIQFYSRFFFSLFFLFSLTFLNAEQDFEAITAIILINGSAELVDVNNHGEILKRHVAIPDYFTSGRSHKRSLGNGMKMIEQYGSVESNFLPESSNLPTKCLQSFMVSITEKVKQEKICSNQLPINLMDSEINSYSYNHSLPYANKPFTLQEGLKMRKKISPSKIMSSESIESYVLFELKYYSTIKKEPLRHRIV